MWPSNIASMKTCVSHNMPVPQLAPPPWGGWKFEEAEFWSFEVLEPWSSEILKFRSPELLKFWSPEVQKFWSFEVIKFGSPEVLKFWSFEVLKSWSSEALKSRSLYIGCIIYYIRYILNHICCMLYITYYIISQNDGVPSGVFYSWARWAVCVSWHSSTYVTVFVFKLLCNHVPSLAIHSE